MSDIMNLNNLNTSSSDINLGKLSACKQANGTLPDLTFTIDDAVNKVGYGKFQIRLLILAGLGWIADSCEIFILSVIGGFIACDWTLYRWQNALLTSIVFAGITIGSPVLGIIADIYGRKKSLSVSVIILFLFGVVSAASPSYVWMVVLRGCMGFGIGGLSQGLTLCTEYCPSNMRGKSGFYLCYFWSVGTCGVILLAWVVMEFLDSWRVLLVVVALPTLVVIISLKWYPESPRYYLVSHQYERAVKILQRMATVNGKELPPGRLIEFPLEEKRGQLKDLLSKEYRLSSFLFWYIWFATAFSYYGIALVSPIIIQNGSLRTETGNSTDGGSDMGNIVPCSRLTQQNYIDLLWTSAAEFPGLILFTFLVERMDRKLLLGGACFIGSILVLLLLLRTEKIIILVILFAARGIILSVFQLIFIVTSETYPTTFRAIAMGFGSSFCRIGGLIVPYVAQVLVIESSIAAMCLLSAVIFLAAVASAFLPFETRGADMKEARCLKAPSS